MDTAADALGQATSALDIARRQYELTKAGAWTCDIANQQKHYDSLEQAYQASNALLRKFSVRAQADGVVLSVNASVAVMNHRRELMTLIRSHSPRWS